MSQVDMKTDGSFKRYEDAVRWVTGLVSFGMKPGLSRMEWLMERLDYPNRRLKFIHVAGTNGKGSTCAYISHVLMECEYDVGTFTSPYIEKFTNRIQYNGKDIPEEDVLRLVNMIKPLADELADTELGQPTMFEVVTTMALLYFARITYPDYVVWETGLGGRLDSTNIVHPLLSVITNIGHDHMEILGDTLTQVAEEKAGIIKSGVPVISAVQQPEAVEVIQRKAEEKKSTLYLLGKQFQYKIRQSQIHHQTFDFSGPFGTYEQLTVTMNGPHQVENAAVAVMALEVLRQYYATLVEDDTLRAGLEKTTWPGRLELIAENPRILLDGAHNPEGAKSLADSLKHLYSYEKLHLMIGMLANKNHRGYLEHILPLVDRIIVTEPDFGNRLDAAKLSEIAKNLLKEANVGKDIDIVVEPSWRKALELLMKHTGPEDLAIVSGTLYLISDVRSWILYHAESEKGW